VRDHLIFSGSLSLIFKFRLTNSSSRDEFCTTSHKKLILSLNLSKDFIPSRILKREMLMLCYYLNHAELNQESNTISRLSNSILFSSTSVQPRKWHPASLCGRPKPSSSALRWGQKQTHSSADRRHYLLTCPPPAGTLHLPLASAGASAYANICFFIQSMK